MRHKIKNSYKHLSDASLNLLAHRIIVSMKDNANFTNPVPALAEIETAAGEYGLALNVAGRLDRTRVSDKNDKKIVLTAKLSALATYIDATCQGDKTKLLSSGFDITGQKSEQAALSNITQFAVDIESPGQATTRVNKVHGARSYVHQYTPDPITVNSVWISETVTDRQHTFSNLPSITKVWFRVIAVGRSRQSLHSSTIARVIQ